MRVSVSLLENGHPAKFMAMDCGPWAATLRAPKRGSSSASTIGASQAASPNGRTWLPLTPQQARTFGWVALLVAPTTAQAQGLERDDAAGEAPAAPSQAGAFVGLPGGCKVEFPDGEESRLRHMRATSPSDGAAQVRTEFRISNQGDLPDPTEHIQNGAKRVAQLFATKPLAILPFEDEARKVMMGNQVAQSIRAEQRADDDTTLAALEANAAGQQGVHVALLAVLDYAGGGGSFDPQCGWPIIPPSTSSVRDACWTSASPYGPSGELLQTKTGAACAARSSSPGAHGRAAGCGRRRIWARHRPACPCGRRGGRTGACHPLGRRRTGPRGADVAVRRCARRGGLRQGGPR